MNLHGVFPATGDFIDGLELELLEAVGVLGFHNLVVNPVVEAGQQALGVFRIQVGQVFLRQFFGAVLPYVVINPGDRELGQEAHAGGDYFVLIAQAVGQVEYFRFKGQQRIANATLNEGGGGSTAAAVEYPYLAQEIRQELVNLVLIVAEGVLGITQRGQVGVTAVTGGFRVRHYQGNVFANQVIPVLDVLRVVLANQERHGGIVGGAVVGQALGPVFGDQLAAFVQDVDVCYLIEGSYIGFQALNDGLGLLGRTGVGLVNFKGFTGLFLPVLLEFHVVGGEQLAGNIVRGIE